MMPVLTMDWAGKGNFSGVSFGVLAPGGQGFAPSALIVDKIRVVLVKTPGNE